jgi:hypothetical protein
MKLVKLLKPYQSVIKMCCSLYTRFNYILEISKKCDLVYINKKYAEISKTYENLVSTWISFSSAINALEHRKKKKIWYICYVYIINMRYYLVHENGFFYEIVIGGNGNSVAILRRRSPLIFEDKQYVSVGLYQTRISVLFPEIRLYISYNFHIKNDVLFVFSS